MARSKHYYEKYFKPPLKLQYKAGYEAFNNPKQWTRRAIKGAIVIITSNPYPKETMQSKEWERGYNSAYFNNLKALEIAI
tara:strand:+ start:355 stop:594 length:240 start_codon:yes stop_codon:yes gene_type:complete